MSVKIRRPAAVLAAALVFLALTGLAARAMGGGEPRMITMNGYIRAIGNEPFVEYIFHADDGKEYGLVGEGKDLLMKLQGRKLRVAGFSTSGRSSYMKNFLQLSELTIIYPPTGP